MMRLFQPLSWILLFVAGAFSLLIESGLLIQPVPPDLSRLPERLATIELLEDLPVDPQALGEQPPERYAYRRVRDIHGHEGKLFVAYYLRAQRWSGRPHAVDRCFVSQGWEELEARRLDESHDPWSRRFAREGESIRVVHWLERAGADGDELDWRTLAARLGSSRGFRPDVASIYLEFPEGRAPDDAQCAAFVGALSVALEELW